MNHIYKVVFNQTTQTWTAVAEWAKGVKKKTACGIKHSTKTPTSAYHKRTLLSLSLLVATSGHAASQIVADSQVSKALQPIILPTANGLPQINIQTPNHQGISSNHYSQFDIAQGGVILNNSRKPIATQLAGFVDGNPHLAKGEASLIINQINSNKPSQLNGFVEIAGNKADLIVANPSGIRVDGSGFINTKGVTLTTSLPTIDSTGTLSINNPQKTSGNLVIDGKGLTTQGTDYTSLIANTVETNAKIHAEGSQLTVKTVTSLDVSNLGGMYAGRIHLVGTEAGVGVNNAGDIISSSTLTLDNKGRLINTGIMSAKEGVFVDSQSTHNTGIISSESTVQAEKQNTLVNEGVIQGGQLLLQANQVTNKGVIKQNAGQLSLSANKVINKDQAVIGNKINTPDADAPETTTPLTAQTSSNTHIKDGYIRATVLENTGAKAQIASGGTIDIDTKELINSNGGIINVKKLNPGEHFTNQGGTVQLETIDWQLKSFNNQDGALSATEGMKLAVAGPINNQSGKLLAGGELALQTQLTIDNESGAINGQTVKLNAGHLNNQKGHVFGKQSLTARAYQIDNTEGQIGGGKLSLSADSRIINDKGLIHGEQVEVTTDNLHNSGQIHAKQSANIQSQNLTNAPKGIISSGLHLDIHTQSLANQGVLAAGMNTDGSLTGNAANLTVSAKALVSQGKHIATGDATLSAETLDLSNSHSQADNLTLTGKQGINLSESTQIASGSMSLNTEATIDNTKGNAQAGTLQVFAKKLINREGKITQTGTEDLSIKLPEGLDNTEGFIGSSGKNLTIQTNHLDNQKGTITHTGLGQSQITATTLNNLEAKIGSLGKQSIVAQEVNNQSGQIYGASFDIEAVNLNNHLGKIAALNAYDAVNSRLFASKLNNTEGYIHNQKGTLSLQTGVLDNQKGTISADTLALDSSHLTNTGLIYAAKEAHIKNSQSIHNDSLIASGGNLKIDTQSFHQTQKGKLIAGLLEDQITLSDQPSSLNLTASSVIDSQGKHIAIGDATLKGQSVSLQHSQNQAQNLMVDSDSTINLNHSKNDVANTLTLTATKDISHNHAQTVTDKLNVKAHTLSNNQGVIHQTGTETLNLSLNTLNNQQGVIEAKAQTTQITAGHFNNQQGQLTVNQGAVTTQSINNAQGVIYGENLVIQNTHDLNNTQGTLLSKTLAIQSGHLNNTAGLIHQEDQQSALTLTVTNALTNNNTKAPGLGVIADKVQIQAQAISNVQGSIQANTLAVATQGLNNTQGIIQAYNSKLDAGHLKNTDGQMTADTLDLTVTQYTHEQSSDIQANTLNLKATGGLNNQGKLTAHTLSVDANHLHNGVGATLASDTHAAIKATTLTNQGLINSKGITHLQVSDEINNLSYGRIYGKHLAIATKTLNNTPDAPPSANAPAPIIAAYERLDIGVRHLNNNPNPARAGVFNKDFDGQAQIISLGSLHIGGALDANLQAIGKATAIINTGATIESGGRMSIHTNQLANDNAGFSKHKVVVAEESRYGQTLYRSREEGKNGDPAYKIYTADEAYLGPTKRKGAPQGALYAKDSNGQYQFVGEEIDEITLDTIVYQEKTLTSDPARLVSGKQLYIYGDDLVNNKSQLNAGLGYEIEGDEIRQDPDGQLQAQKTQEVENGSFISRTVESKQRGFKDGHVRVDRGRGTYTQDAKNLETYQLPILDSTVSATPSAINQDKIAWATGIQSVLTTLSNQHANHLIDSQKVLEALAKIDKVQLESLDVITQAQFKALLDESKTTNAIQSLTLARLLNRLEHHIIAMKSIEVRTEQDEISLPIGKSLTPPNNHNLPLIQSDPDFNQYKSWLSSDYLLTRLGQDPDAMQKRLNDGMGEQERLKNSYFNLTGKHLLSDYSDSDNAYKALMGSALAQKDRLSLRVGIALTAEQMRHLTDDLVWMVKKSVKLPDGSHQEVLVPQLYVVANRTAVTGDKSGIYGKYGNINASRVDNKGNIYAQKHLTIDTQTLLNTKSANIGADTAHINAKTLDNTDGRLHANTAMAIQVQDTLLNHSDKQKATISVGEGALAGADANELPVTLSIWAGKFDNKGSLIQNLGGKTLLEGQQGVSLDAKTTTHNTQAFANANNYYQNTVTADEGTTLQGVSDILVRSSEGGIYGKALQASSGGSLTFLAKQQITLEEGRHKEESSGAYHQTERGSLNKKQRQGQFDSKKDTAITSQLEAKTLVVQGGGDVVLKGVEAVADEGAMVKGKNISLLAAANTQSDSSSSQSSKSGLLKDGGVAFTLGKTSNKQTDASTQTHYTSTTLGVLNGNVIIDADEQYIKEASDVKAYMGADTGKGIKDKDRGNVIISAKNIDVLSLNENNTQETSSHHKKSGLSVGVSNSLVDTANSTKALIEAGRDVDSHRAKAMAALGALSKIHSTSSEVKNIGQLLNQGTLGVGDLGSTRIQATLGNQTSQSHHLASGEQNHGSTIDAAGSVALIAKGDQHAGKNTGVINIQGSTVQVGNDLYQSAAKVNYTASTQNLTEQSTDNSKGFGVGVYAQTGASKQGGHTSYGITANISQSKGNGTTQQTVHTNTIVNVGGTTYNDILGDFTLDGATLDTKHITGTIDGDLIIKSRQDTYEHHSQQKNIGAGLDVSLTGQGSSLNLNAGKQNLDANYKAVTTQSGIKAQTSDLVVEGQGKLTGGYFLTQDEASNQTIFKEGITTENIHNELSYQGKAIQAGIGISRNEGKNSASPTALGYGNIDPVHKTTTTYSAVTGQAGQKHTTLTSKDSLNEPLINHFDSTAANKALTLQTQITAEFNAERKKVRAEYAQQSEEHKKQAKQAREQGNIELAKDLETKASQIDSNLRLFDGITSALYAPNANGIIGDTVRTLSPQVAYQIGQYFKENKVKNQQDNSNRPEEQSLPHLMAHAILGAAVSHATGNDVASGALAGASSEYTAPILTTYLFNANDPKDLSQEQKDTITNIITLAGATTTYSATGDVGSTINASEVGKVGVENNAATSSKQIASIVNRQQKECQSLGIPSNQCGQYHGEKSLETLKEVGLFIVPTTPEEVALAVVTGGAGRYVIKAGGKVISKVFKSKDEAEKVLGEAKEAKKIDNNFYRDGSQFESNIINGKPIANLRLEYVDEVQSISNHTQRMLNQGKSEEEVAVWAINKRNELKVKYRGDTPPEKLREIELRNIEKYGNALGPTAHYLRQKGKTWKEIIDSASKADGSDLDFAPKGFNR